MLTREQLHVLDLLQDNPNLGALYDATRFEGPVRRVFPCVAS
ncbi:MAG: hypothetical protein R3B13_14840 [Polyangiaceae bacterium]